MNNMQLPTGIAKIENTDLGCGETLIVTMANGMRVIIDANQMTEHQCQVGVLLSEAEDPEMDRVLGGIAFDPKLPLEATVVTARAENGYAGMIQRLKGYDPKQQVR
jgi:hypothetical protein